MIELFNSKKKNKHSGRFYENSTQDWLPIETVKDGIVVLKDGRYIKILEIVPVNFYLKSEVEQENIIYYYASYLKIAPDNIQIRVNTETANIDEYLSRHEYYAESEVNDEARAMIYDEMNFVRGLSDNIAVKKRFYIIFEYTPKAFVQNPSFADVYKSLTDEAYKAERDLSQCELGVISIDDDAQLVDLLYSFINKRSARYAKPGNFAGSMIDEIHTFEGGVEVEEQ